jgi:hypothetical protein
VVALVLAVAALGALVWYFLGALERQRELEELRVMRDSLASLRTSADECRSGLAREESEFRSFDAHLDSLRRRIAAYEELHPDGVPSREYQDYLEVFDRYNLSVGEWEARADSLRAREARCRAVVELHNAFADSLRTRVEIYESDTDAPSGAQ